jgi:hypothetical protein
VFKPPEMPKWLPELVPGLEPAKGLECCQSLPRIMIMQKLRIAHLECPTDENRRRMVEAERFVADLDRWLEHHCKR